MAIFQNLPAENNATKAAKKKRRQGGVGKPIQKGQILNPGGRPKVLVEVRKLAQEHGVEAFNRILELMHCQNPNVSFAAAQEVLNRAYGKPSQEITAGDVGASLLIGLLARIAGRDEDTPPLEIESFVVRNGGAAGNP